MRLLLRYFNSGRIPFGFPDSSCVLALICMGGVLMLLKVILGAREKGDGRQWTAAHSSLYNGAGAATDIRLFKACCNPSSIPVRLGAKRVHGGNVDVAHDAVVSRGIRAAMGCQRSPAVTRGGPTVVWAMPLQADPK